ncbi:hypothetical protein WN51_08931 [Melipona quadrifasciata]|uniref:Uncharacterized protein n=1 Tax=Melipona quadrifasciata TaxID=166423 RepID=A0A0M8ZQD3_9HYME|nr:hypothetical protein WN51_08931 [Melipona quadrifasciata]
MPRNCHIAERNHFKRVCFHPRREKDENFTRREFQRNSLRAFTEKKGVRRAGIVVVSTVRLICSGLTKHDRARG